MLEAMLKIKNAIRPTEFLELNGTDIIVPFVRGYQKLRPRDLQKCSSNRQSGRPVDPPRALEHFGRHTVGPGQFLVAADGD